MTGNQLCSFSSLERERDRWKAQREKLEDKAALALLLKMRGFFDRYPYAVEFQDCMGVLVLLIRQDDAMLLKCGWSEGDIAEVTEESRLDKDFLTLPGEPHGIAIQTEAARELWELYSAACEAVDEDHAFCSLLWLNDCGTINRENLAHLIEEQQARCGRQKRRSLAEVGRMEVAE